MVITVARVSIARRGREGGGDDREKVKRVVVLGSPRQLEIGGETITCKVALQIQQNPHCHSALWRRSDSSF